MVDIKSLTPEQKKVLLYVLEADIGAKHMDTEKAEDPFLAESRKCNIIAKMKKEGKSVVFTEYQF